MKMKDSLFKLWVLLSGSIVTSVAAGIFLYLFFKGFSVISPEFILGSPRGIPLGTEGGIFPAIAGSLMSGAIAGILGGALSLCTAVYLVFYCKSEKIHSYILHALQCLAGIPSVVVGLFGYSFLIVSMRIPKSLLSASITLTVMIIPFISIRIKKALEHTSKEQFIGSLSLGIPRGYTIVRLIIPASFRYIMTSLSLGVVFAMGAAAPVMFTGAVIISGVPSSLSKPFMALPYHLYILVNEGLSVEMAYGTALVLMVTVLLINIICRIIASFEDI